MHRNRTNATHHKLDKLGSLHALTHRQRLGKGKVFLAWLAWPAWPRGRGAAKQTLQPIMARRIVSNWLFCKLLHATTYKSRPALDGRVALQLQKDSEAPQGWKPCDAAPSIEPRAKPQPICYAPSPQQPRFTLTAAIQQANSIQAFSGCPTCIHLIHDKHCLARGPSAVKVDEAWTQSYRVF